MNISGTVVLFCDTVKLLAVMFDLAMNGHIHHRGNHSCNSDVFTMKASFMKSSANTNLSNAIKKLLVTELHKWRPEQPFSVYWSTPDDWSESQWKHQLCHSRSPETAGCCRWKQWSPSDTQTCWQYQQYNAYYWPPLCKKHIIKHLIVEFLVINQIKFDDDNTSQKNQRVLQLTLSKEPRVSYLIYQHNVSHSI